MFLDMMDSMVEEVGEENVIQVVTDNAANYRVVGQMLITKRKRLFWAPCVAHYIDLMLEDYEKKILIHDKTIPKGKKNYYLYLFKIFSNFSTITFHKRKRFGAAWCYSFRYILPNIRMPT